MLHESTDNPRIYRQVAEKIIQRIELGLYKPGERLPAERTLANLFNVSRSSLREALIVLETEDRIEVRSGSGVYVRENCQSATAAVITHPKCVPGAFEVFQGRDLIEPEVAALAATHALDSNIQDLQDALGKMVCCAADDPMHLVFDRQFHLALAEASGNSALYLSMETLWGFRTEPGYTALHRGAQSSTAWQASILEHRDIFVAVMNREPASAKAAMQLHLKRAKIRLSAARAASNAPSTNLRASA